MDNGWYPATTIDPSTCATFRLLDLFRLLKVVVNVNANDFVQSLERLTDATFTRKVPERYKSFIRMSRQWDFLTRAKRAGRGNYADGVETTPPGGLAVWCWACPDPARNLPKGWDKVDEKRAFLYCLMLALDANFRLKNRIRANERHDPSLGPGLGYFVLLLAYKEFLKHYVAENDVSTCIAFQALMQKETRLTTGLRVSGEISKMSKVRGYLQAKKHMVNHRNANVVGQRESTRSNTVVTRIVSHEQREVLKYRDARSAGHRPKGDAFAPQFLELRDEDVRVGIEVEVDEVARAQLGRVGNAKRVRSEPTTQRSGKAQALSWIWRVGGQTDMDELHDAIRVQWSKALARRDRWVEEVELLKEEMRRVLRSLETVQREWMAREDGRKSADAELAAGARAYAKKQRVLHSRISELFQARWSASAAETVRRVVAQAQEDSDEEDEESMVVDGGSETSMTDGTSEVPPTSPTPAKTTKDTKSAPTPKPKTKATPHVEVPVVQTRKVKPKPSARKAPTSRATLTNTDNDAGGDDRMEVDQPAPPPALAVKAKKATKGKGKAKEATVEESIAGEGESEVKEEDEPAEPVAKKGKKHARANNSGGSPPSKRAKRAAKSPDPVKQLYHTKTSQPALPELDTEENTSLVLDGLKTLFKQNASYSREVGLPLKIKGQDIALALAQRKMRIPRAESYAGTHSFMRQAKSNTFEPWFLTPEAIKLKPLEEMEKETPYEVRLTHLPQPLFVNPFRSPLSRAPTALSVERSAFPIPDTALAPGCDDRRSHCTHALSGPELHQMWSTVLQEAELFGPLLNSLADDVLEAGRIASATNTAHQSATWTLEQCVARFKSMAYNLLYVAGPGAFEQRFKSIKDASARSFLNGWFRTMELKLRGRTSSNEGLDGDTANTLKQMEVGDVLIANSKKKLR
ncbi:CxC2 domain-containing protein [Mycena kentingensis (nom. inval.)]|nr:CxC2 domain-containing protein [Mycena kentingensis (nom. inval.)]